MFMDITSTPNLATPAATKPTITPQQQAKMRAAATDFEAYYITQFLGLMKSKNEATVFNGGTGEDLFRQELNNEMGKHLAKTGGFGIADKIYAELVKQQEAKPHGAE
jgi:peptidoglycan hydrolase FlgJ